jgi:uroporphyrinogen decarboxylase
LIGSINDVQKEVSARIDTLGRGGGYVLAPAHNIQPDTPPENIVELYRFTKKEGKYIERLSI